VDNDPNELGGGANPAESPGINLEVPTDLARGVFADFVGVWHNPYGFTLDFGVFDMASPGPDGTAVLPATVVARIKVPPGLIFQIAQAIADNVDKYERSYGPITPRPFDTAGTETYGPPETLGDDSGS